MYRFSKKSKTKEPESPEHAYNYVLFLLNLRLRTEGELRYKMRERGYTEDVINSTIEQLLQKKYIDDERFAEILTENLKKYKNHGYYQIKKKLMGKRLSEKTILETLEKHFTLEDERAVAVRFLKKEKTVPSVSFQARQKLAARLKARGFRNQIISELLI
jgi:regulatory protein